MVRLTLSITPSGCFAWLNAQLKVRKATRGDDRLLAFRALPEGRAVAGSNPVSPMKELPGNEHLFVRMGSRALSAPVEN